MLLLLLFTLILLPDIADAQPDGNLRETYMEGEYFLNRGDYKEAAYYFKKVLDSDAQNSNFNFKLGECYMNMPGSETLAVPCFEIAVKSTVEKKKYRTRDFYEKNAPLHAWFYLGNVYRIAGRLDEALKAYDTFISSPHYYGNYNENIVENEIKSCERARIIMDTPVDAEIQRLDTVVNTDASEFSPVISADEKTLIFVRRLKLYDAIFSVSYKDSSWGNPVNLNPQVGSDGDFYPVFLTADGNTLYLVRNNPGNKDLYVSYKKNNVWTKAVSLGKNVNTSADETWASVSADGQTLWFTSSRKGGKGGLDIYYSRLDKNNRWGKAKNAGKVINTPFDEESPCITSDGKRLFFSSKGHYSMGGFDIFYSTWNGKAWENPVNIGFPVNNTSDNKGYVPAGRGNVGYYSFAANSGDAAEDVYKVILKNHPNP